MRQRSVVEHFASRERLAITSEGRLVATSAARSKCPCLVTRRVGEDARRIFLAYASGYHISKQHHFVPAILGLHRLPMPDAQKSPHAIRLHAAWQRTELTNSMAVIHSRAISLPDVHELDPATCSLAYVRKFNAPTGLTEHDIVEIDCPMLMEATSITLNGLPLIKPDSATIDITRIIQKHNELTIHLDVSKIEVARIATARLLISTS